MIKIISCAKVGRTVALSAILGWSVLDNSPNVFANAILNGDFATGDFTGWQLSAIDANGNAVSPLIQVMDLGGVNSAVFSTGSFENGPFISTLQQTFTVTPAEPVLSFDFSLPKVTTDPTGTALSPSPDSMVVSVQDGGSRELLLVTRDGALADPFGTAPGLTTLGPSGSSLLQYNFQADLSALAGSEVTLFIEVINQDDGFVSVFDPTLFMTQAPDMMKAHDVVPTLFLFIPAFSALAILDRWPRRRQCR